MISLKDKIKAYVIFNITKNQYIFISEKYKCSRRFLVYGDLASARRMMNDLKKYYYKNDELRIVEMIPNEDWK